jgi:PAS domain S-box-containing protein
MADSVHDGAIAGPDARHFHRALVVDDLELLRGVIASHLRELGVEDVRFARDGSEALDLLTHHPADVVISDVHMPVLDGFQLCRLMRSHAFPALNRTPVVLVSATYKDHNGARLSHEVGAQAFLQWPIGHEDLAAALVRARADPDELTPERPRILVVDDDSDIRRALTTVLQQAGFEPHPAQNGEEAIAAGESWRPHLVLCDYMMPKVDGRGVLAWFRKHRPDTPVIILTAFGSDDLAVELMRSGAYDYFPKPLEMRTLAARCRSALEKFSLRRISRQFEEMLEAVRRSELRYRALVEHAADAVLVLGRDGQILEANRRAEEMLGRPRTGIAGQALSDLVSEERRESVRAQIQGVFSGRAIPGDETVLRGADGREIWANYSLSRVEGEGVALALLRDVTHQKQIEQQLRESQKIEAVGRLAGGVAHDFNNVLAVILGCAGFLIEELAGEPDLRRDVEEIAKAGQRAATLTRQLLAFSRKQVLQPEELDLNVVVTDMEKMLRRLIGEHINLFTVRAEGLGLVKADPGQLTQVIMNLVVNARDAMPDGGLLTLRTANVELDGTEEPAALARRGSYVLLEVRDTGCGMSEQVQAHIFEPFFTTKPKDKGTGLGLATVYGIVAQSGGHIAVESEVGMGTTFRIYLPRIEGAALANPLAALRPSASAGSGTVLVVEDDGMVMSLVRRILEAAGYSVIEARHGPEALSLCDAHAGAIDLVLTDVVLPGMSGRDVALRVRERRPDAKLLYMSGYTDDIIVRHGALEPGTHFIQKPFTAPQLTGKVRDLLGSCEGGV